MKKKKIPDGIKTNFRCHKFLGFLHMKFEFIQPDNYLYPLIVYPLINLVLYEYVSVSRLMGSTGATSMNMSNMTCSDTKPMQFPLTQRRKRRVLFTQAQVSHYNFKLLFINNVFHQKRTKISKEKAL